jgi:HNH endonuclease
MATLVLNNAFQPLGGATETDAVILIATGKAFAIRSNPARVYRSQHLEIPAPSIVVLGHFQEMKSFKIRPAQLSNHALFKRDDHRCQYCGRHEDELKVGNKLTRDHIIPRNQGGKDHWENVTTACATCNHRKDDRTPQQAKMKLLSTPTIPVTWTIRGKGKLNQNQIDYIEELLNLKK